MPKSTYLSLKIIVAIRYYVTALDNTQHMGSVRFHATRDFRTSSQTLVFKVMG